MIAVKIVTLDKGKMSSGIIDNMMDGAILYEGTLERAEIIEEGMESGKTAIAFIISLPNGSKVIAQTSAALLNGINSAVKGAEARWNSQ